MTIPCAKSENCAISDRARHRQRTLALLIGPLAAIALLLAATWIIPFRLLYGQESSYFAFAYIADEYAYAMRMAPLIGGTTAANPFNGIGDSQIISPYFLESACRWLMHVGGTTVIDFFWIWRFLFPVALLLAAAVLVRACLPWRQRPWSLPLLTSCVALSLATVLGGYYLFFPSPPWCQCDWLMRIPSNAEFVLALLLVAAFLAFWQKPDARRAVLLAAASLATYYLRPYTAVPWALVFSGACIWLLLSGRLNWRIALLLLTLLVLGALPFAAVNRINATSPVFQDWQHRLYASPQEYAIHRRWPLQIGLAVAIALSARLVARDKRPFFWCIAGALLALPFLCALLWFRREMMHESDRFCVFYLPALTALFLLIIANQMNSARGSAGVRLGRRWVMVCIAVAVLAAAGLACLNSTLELNTWGHDHAVAEARYLPAYEWISQHTPAGSLFIVDDGRDFAKLPDTPEVTASPYHHAPLFQVLSRRRAVYAENLGAFWLSTRDYVDLLMLQRGTFGVSIQMHAYKEILKRFQPSHIFWRKELPVPRGYGVQLQSMAKVVYDDALCQVWELRYR